MIQSLAGAHRTGRHGRLAGGTPAAALLAFAMLGACMGDQPVGPRRAAPDAPSLALNPACDPGLGGQTHTDSILAPETWTRANNPHHVNTFIHIEGAGVLTLEPGVLVCFTSLARLTADHGGRLVADGRDTARIVLTASDTEGRWWGVLLAGTPASPSIVRHARFEYAGSAPALFTAGEHAALVDSSVFRQNHLGVYLEGRGSRLSRSRVDTTTLPGYSAVYLGSNVVFEQNTIRNSAGIGLNVTGTHGIKLLGGRIEGSAGLGLRVTTTGPGLLDTDPIRVTGGASYPAELVVSALARIYPTLPDQDSLLGNARDTVVVTGGILQAWAVAGPALPWRVTDDIVVQNTGILIPKPGATLAFTGFGEIIAWNGGRVVARGTAAAPVRFTSATPPDAWGGIYLGGSPSLGSYLTNVRIEYTGNRAVMATDSHAVVVDSAVFRQNGIAAQLLSGGSRMSRSRVDTTLLQGSWAAVDIAYNTILESTLIRGAGGIGLRVRSNEAQVLSCEVRESAGDGIESWLGAAVHNCNLVNNGGVGITDYNGLGVNAEDNWWGDAAGPTGPSGDGVAGTVDYTPWRTTPYVLPYVP